MLEDPALWLGLLLLALGLFFSVENLALRHASRARLSELFERRGRMDQGERFLASLHTLTLATATLRMIALLGLTLVVVHYTPGTPAQWGPPQYLLAFAVSGVLTLIFAVAIPNAWAKYAGEGLLVATCGPLRAIELAVRPITAFLHLFDGLVRRLAGVPHDNGNNHAEQVEQEILKVVSEGQVSGAVDEQEKEMIESVIEMRESSAGQIMTPRTEMVGLDVHMSLAEVKEVINREGHSRLPVYRESLDQIIGVLYAKDLLQIEDPDVFGLEGLARKVPLVPESKPLRDLLAEFKANKVHLAIVLDEYGGTAGLVTFEDILEELVGEIQDEYEPPEPEPFQRIDDHTAEVDARFEVEAFNDRMHVELPESSDYETLGGFVFSKLGHIPQAGEQLSHDNVYIEVLSATERRIERLRIRVDPDARPEPHEE